MIEALGLKDPEVNFSVQAIINIYITKYSRTNLKDFFFLTWFNSEIVDMTDFGEINHHYVIRIGGSRGGSISMLIKKYFKCDPLTEIC